MAAAQLKLEPHPRGTLLPVLAQPGAGRQAINGTHDGMLRVAVTAAAEKGKANTAVAKLLAKVLGVARSEVELVSGATSRRKRFLVVGLTPDTLVARLSQQ